MKNIILFLSFILYVTFIFFINSNTLLLVVLLLNVLVMIVLHIRITEAIRNVLKILPFVLFTVAINCILSNYKYAILVGIKLLLVCNITYTYSKTTTVRGIATLVKKLCTPLKFIKVNPDEIELLVCISLSMIPILKREYNQLKDACLAKGMDIDVKNMKIILTKLMISIMKRVNEIEESIIEKGYGEI